MQQKLEQHGELLQINRELSEFIQRPRPEPDETGAREWAAALYHQLVTLHERLTRHFLGREQGLLSELRSSYPRATHQLGQMREEHGQLLTTLRGLIADALCYAESTCPPDPHLRDRSRRLLDGISAHESSVTELVQELILTDLGSGD
ncbi:MAG: hypothetical protein JSV80_01460 [Acidobacteriota bacterium]|nr:MAG: hypothetical protein JSV80_01460 [Acidobacteriota bacterium]